MRNIFAILSLVTVLYVVSCVSSAEKPTQAENVSTSQSNAAQPAPLDDAPRITIADAKKDYDAGTVVIVDVRAESAYKEEHIKGSLNITIDTMAANLNKLPKGKKIIAYCS
ncbi:MAG: rhodanese-like domain-containing protein [Pyrinomonadaceae bacterium]